MTDRKLFLLRYDTEWNNPTGGKGTLPPGDAQVVKSYHTLASMAGFFEKAVEVHRRDRIPATFFCQGAAVDSREEEFRDFYREVKGDRLFDLQDHSYSHIGLGYTRGQPVEVIRANYERSFAVHERVFAKRPIGISICGTPEGPRLSGFDATDKGRAEFEMVAHLGVRMINTFLSSADERSQFINYAALSHPEIMGFPSAYGDTGWMVRREHGEPVDYILTEISRRAEEGKHMPLMLHDWVAWHFAEDQELTHVRRFVERARALGYELVTHYQCLLDETLWR
jgi:peptidoglycan/xylan/chitin deacetylase (PgdA/CDA1 family)